MERKGQECVPEGMKICHKCRKSKHVSEFHKGALKCKTCMQEYASSRYREKNPESRVVDGPFRQDAIVKMLERLDSEYEKKDNKRFSEYVEKNYGLRLCSKCNKLRPISDFGVIKTQSGNQCISCFRESKNSATKKILQTKDGLNKAYMRDWFKNRGVSARDVPDDIKNVVIKMVELNRAIRHTGGI